MNFWLLFFTHNRRDKNFFFNLIYYTLKFDIGMNFPNLFYSRCFVEFDNLFLAKKNMKKSQEKLLGGKMPRIRLANPKRLRLLGELAPMIDF